MKPVKNSLVLFILIILGSALLLFGCGRGEPEEIDRPAAAAPAPVPMPVPDTDSVSAASDTYYFEDNTLSSEELADVIHNLSGGALAASTVNADGSPNLAFIGPDMITDDVLMFGLSDNQTRINILARKIVVVGVYLFDPESEGGITDSRGARIVLELIEDKTEIASLMDLVPDAPDDVLFMRIVRVLPVG